MSKIASMLFIALAAIIFTAERVSEKIVCVAQKAAATVAGHPYEFYPASPNFSKCYKNPALWVCLIIAFALFFFGPKEIRKDND